MKTKIYLIISILSFSAIIFGQTQDDLKYSTRLRNSDGTPLSNQLLKFRVSILKGDTSAKPTYSEIHSLKTDSLGVINFVIGTGTEKSGSLDSVDFSTGKNFIKLETDQTGNNNFVLLGVRPYVVHLAKKDSSALKTNTDPDNKLDLDKLKNEIYDEMLLAGMNGLLKDAEGNLYKTKKIGSQIWMVENLRSTKFNDGTKIQLVTDSKDWSNQVKPAFCWYMNDTTYKAGSGALYNWYTIETKKLCPAGWHVSSQADLNVLETFLGGSMLAGGKMKEVSPVWLSPNAAADNSSGFSAFPSGYRGNDGTFYYFGDFGDWWLSTEFDNNSAKSMNLFSGSGRIYRNITGKSAGLSVRCVKD